MYLVLGYFFFCFIFKMLLPLIKKSSFERFDHLLPTMFMSLIETQLEFQVVRWIDNPKVDSSIDHTIPSFLGCQNTFMCWTRKGIGFAIACSFFVHFCAHSRQQRSKGSFRGGDMNTQRSILFHLCGRSLVTKTSPPPLHRAVTREKL